LDIQLYNYLFNIYDTQSDSFGTMTLYVFPFDRFTFRLHYYFRLLLNQLTSLQYFVTASLCLMNLRRSIERRVIDTSLTHSPLHVISMCVGTELKADIFHTRYKNRNLICLFCFHV